MRHVHVYETAAGWIYEVWIGERAVVIGFATSLRPVSAHSMRLSWRKAQSRRRAGASFKSRAIVAAASTALTS